MDENSGTEQEQQPGTKAGSIKDTFKRVMRIVKASPTTVIAVLAAAFLVLTAIVVLTVVRSNAQQGNINNELPDNIITPAAEGTLSYQELLNQVKLVFYNYNISRDMVLESVKPDTPPVYTIQVTTENGDAVRRDILEVFRVNRLTPLYSEGANHLVAETEDFRFELYIKSGRQTVSPVTPPVVKTEPVLPPKGNGRIALLIDDAGMNLRLAEELLGLNVPVAVAVLPHMPHSRETADLVRAKGQTVFLHYPMEPLSYPDTDPGPGAALLHMPELLIVETTKQNVENLGRIDGVNNHTGSAFTADAEKMLQMLESLRPYTTRFVDSNTNSQSVAYELCKEDGGFKCGLNRKFLDNESDHDYIREKLYEAAVLANRNGKIITIGHLRPDTITVLKEEIPKLQKLGYSFVSIDSLTD